MKALIYILTLLAIAFTTVLVQDAWIACGNSTTNDLLTVGWATGWLGSILYREVWQYLHKN